MEPVTQQHAERVPGKCGGKPCIKGTRIRVWDIYVANEISGHSPDEIVADYPHLSLADVYAALAYYWDNKAEIDAEMKSADKSIEHLQKATAGPGILARKLASMDADGDTISS